MLFLDTSIIVSLYVHEDKSTKSQKLVSSYEPLAICPLAEVEFYSAIARLNQMKMLSKADAEHVLNSFSAHVEQGYFAFYPIDQNVYNKARQWLGELKTPLRSLDALQLAVADLNGLVFATADRALSRSAKKLGVACKTV